MGKRELLAIAIATLITIVSWAVLDTIHHTKQVEVAPDWQSAAEPLDPNFDVSVLEVVR